LLNIIYPCIIAKKRDNDLKKQSKERIDDFAPGGGYVFNMMHNIQLDVPIKNLVTMFETFEKYARY